MKEIDKQMKGILTELIKNPRISDNQIAKATGIPVKTVNRKRKKLEEENILQYFTMINHGPTGSKTFQGQQMYCITLRSGISRTKATEALLKNIQHSVLNKHVFLEMLGETDGHVVLMLWIMSHHREDIIEIYNAEIIPYLEKLFGANPVRETKVIDVSYPLRVFHNYIPGVNMEKGKIKSDWDPSNFFIG